jgi:hypothetical protein
MSIQLITYDGRTSAACTPRRVYLADDPHAANADPSLRFVLAMCLYAGEILNHRLRGPYRDADARAFARALLIPRELLDRRRLDTARTARDLGVPIRELEIARHAHRCCSARRRPHAGPRR